MCTGQVVWPAQTILANSGSCQADPSNRPCKRSTCHSATCKQGQGPRHTSMWHRPTCHIDQHACSPRYTSHACWVSSVLIDCHLIRPNVDVCDVISFYPNPRFNCTHNTPCYVDLLAPWLGVRHPEVLLASKPCPLQPCLPLHDQASAFYRTTTRREAEIMFVDRCLVAPSDRAATRTSW